MKLVKNEAGIREQILRTSNTSRSVAMKKCYRVEQYPSRVEEKMSSSKALRRKKKSLWSWAPIRAIAKIGQQQFYCVFSIFVQMIDGLPSSLDSLRLVVQLERKSKVWQTMPSRVFQCIAEFDETLHIETTIFGRESNLQDRMLKFMPKDYVLSVVAIDAPEHFLFNQHRIDLSRLLPASVEGFWDPDKPMSSTASFKLGGKAEGAVLVATFDFEVLNEEFRQPSLPIDGDASARYKGSSLRRVPRAVKSLPNSPNPSPFVRRPNYHFTSPCTSDVESTDSVCIEKFDLDSSAKETEEWSAHDYSSSDEERYQALRNDPLFLDALGETEPVALSPAIRIRSLDGFSTKSHMANVDCVEKVEVPLARRTKSETDTLCHHIDFRRLLNCEEPEEEGSVAFQRKQENCKFFSNSDVQVLERNHHLGDLAPDCAEKIEIPSARRKKSETLYDQIDVRRLLNCQEPEEVNIVFESKQENGKSCPHIGVEVLERNSHADELAADKFCINVEIVESCPTANISKVGSNEMTSSNERVEGQCFTGGIMLSPTFVRSKSFDSNRREVLTLGEVELFSEVNEKHMLFDGVQASSPETIKGPLKGAQPPAAEIFSFTTVHSLDEREVCVETPADSNFEVAVQHFWKDVGLESGLAEGLQVSAVAVDGVASKPFESDEDVELDIFQFSAEDEELSLEASVVAEDFLDLLEREGENTCSGPSSPVALVPEESSRPELNPEECWLSCIGELYSTNNPSPYVQEEMDLFVRTPVKAELSATTYCPQARQERGEAFDCVKPIGEVSQAYAMETSFEDELGLLSIIEAGESEMKKAAQTLRSKERAKMLEDAEIKALMEKWGLTDRVFESSSSNMFPCAARQWRQTSDSTSMIRLKDGGSLKVMNMDSFQPCSNLVLQVSRPVVIPARTSSCVDILGSMASQGLENMTVQAFLRMPLEDLMGLSMEQFVASEVDAEDGGLSYSSSTSPPRQGSSPGHTTKESSAVNCTDCTVFKPLDLQCLSEEVVSFGDLTHTALKRIEPLALEGLKVQCNFSKAAPDSVYIKNLAIQNSKMNQVTTDVVHKSSHPHDGAQIQLSSAKSLLDMTISLDDWLQLCEGVKKVESEIPVSQLYLETQQRDECSKVDDISGRTRASLSDNLTVAMLLQLRDPQRYYEPVGASMMALVQAERVNQLCARSSVLENDIDAASSNHFKQGIDQLHGIKSGVKLKITGVHVSGVQLPEENTNKPWGNKEQLQSGCRWLVANSRANKSRHVVSQSSTHVEAKAKLGKGELLWSISACVHTTGTSRREQEDLCPYIRNPDLTFATDDATNGL